MIRICFHGAESTGKTVLIEKLSRELGLRWVPEYGRAFAESHGTKFTMADLLAMAEGQDAAMQAAAMSRPALLLLDTDPLMTAAWAQMLFGQVPDSLLRYEKAELYLLFQPDVDWLDDGTRMFGTPALRVQFAAISEAILDRAQVRYERVGGNWAERERTVRQCIDRLAGA